MALLVIAACGGPRARGSEVSARGSAEPPRAPDGSPLHLPHVPHDTTTPPNLFDAPERLSARLLVKGARAFAITPDGAWVVYTGTDGISAIRPDGSGKRVLRRAPPGIAPAQFRISADSKTVVFATADHDQLPQGHAYAVAIDGGQPIQLTAEEDHVSGMEITPDGKWVAITRMGRAPVTLAPIGGGAERPFLDDHPLGMTYLMTTDGRVVYRGTRPQIRDLLGGTSRDLAPNVPEAHPFGLIDGAAVVTAGDRVWVAPLDGSNAVRIDPAYTVPPFAISNGRGFVFRAGRKGYVYVDAKTRAPRMLNRPLVEPEDVLFLDSTRTAALYDLVSKLDFPGRRHEIRMSALDGTSDRALAYAKDALHVTVRGASDRRAVVHVTTDDRKIAVFSIAIDTGTITRLTPMWPEPSGDFVVGDKHALVDVQGALYIIDLP
jgi:hypothetical protein